MDTKYKRVLLKISGGALGDSESTTFSQKKINHIADEILELKKLGIEVSIVIGGGNLFRGNLSEQWKIDRVEADNIGTLSTVINCLILRGVLQSKTPNEVRVMTSIPITSVAEPYIRLKAISHLSKGYIVIFAGGNGQPFVTTDYPAVQRAIESKCDALLVAKNGVDGVYDDDPNINSSSKRYDHLNYFDAITQDLNVMDQSSLLLARDHNLPLHIFDFNQKGAMKTICNGTHIGTTVSSSLTSLNIED